MAKQVAHRRKQHLSNGMGQDHRRIMQRYYPMRGFGNFASASRFCAALDRLRSYFRPRHRANEHTPLVELRRLFADRWQASVAEMATAQPRTGR